MRKWILPIILILALVTLVGGIYVFIPNKLPVSSMVVIEGTMNSLSRVIADPEKWKPWWPDSTQKNTSLVYDGYRYDIIKGLHNAAEVDITYESDTVKTYITLLPINKDSIALEWRFEMETGSAPWTKISNNGKARDLKENMQMVLTRFKAFVEKSENIYGIPVVRTKVKDTLLIVTTSRFAAIPTIDETYRLINILKTHAIREGVPQTGSPMIHVLPVNPGYEMMVALPVGKAPAENNQVTIRRMVPGNILVTEIKGGPWTIAHAFRQLENYVYDHRYESPAKPFQSLVTKRDVEKDTAQWVTRIYYPIF
jgi:hypothetical protein